MRACGGRLKRAVAVGVDGGAVLGWKPASAVSKEQQKGVSDGVSVVPKEREIFRSESESEDVHSLHSRCGGRVWWAVLVRAEEGGGMSTNKHSLACEEDLCFSLYSFREAGAQKLGRRGAE